MKDASARKSVKRRRREMVFRPAVRPTMKRLGAAFLLSVPIVLLGGQGMAAPVRSVGERSTGSFASPPHRVMSLNICTDQLLLSLAPEKRIASVTFMAREPQPAKIWPQAKVIPVNYGSAEEVLAGPFLPPLTRALLARSGARVVQVPLAEDFDQIRAVTRLVAQAVGAKDRGEQLIAQMDADLAQAAAHRPATPVRVAEWGNGGQVPGGAGLFGTLLRTAGARSIAAQDGYYDVESLIAARPQALLYSDTYRGLPSLRRDQDDHPALTGRLPHVFYASFYGCGVPQLAGAALQLQRDLHRMEKP